MYRNVHQWHLIGFVCFSLSWEGPMPKSPVPLGKSLAKNKSSSFLQTVRRSPAYFLSKGLFMKFAKGRVQDKAGPSIWRRPLPFVRGGKLKFYPALALEHDLEIIPLSFVRGGELKSEFEDFPSTDHPLALRVCDWVEGFKILIYFYLNKWCQNKKRASF